MANYANTKSTIAANVYQNGNQEVTANMVKTAINEVVDTLIAGGYLYAGVAHPDDAAVTPDANVFYIASEPGTYTNKGGIVVAVGEVAVLKYNGSWSKDASGAVSILSLTMDFTDFSLAGYWSGFDTFNNDNTYRSTPKKYVVGVSDVKVKTQFPHLATAIYVFDALGNIVATYSTDDASIEKDFEFSVPAGGCFVVNGYRTGVNGADESHYYVRVLETDQVANAVKSVDKASHIDATNFDLGGFWSGDIGDSPTLNDDSTSQYYYIASHRIPIEKDGYLYIKTQFPSAAPGVLVVDENNEILNRYFTADTLVLGSFKIYVKAGWSVYVNGYKVGINGADPTQYEILVPSTLFDVINNSARIGGENVIFVGDGKGCQFSQIQDAIDSITDDSPSNHYTIIAFPKVYRPIHLGTFQTDTDICRYISVIGLDKYNTICLDTSGTYLGTNEIRTNGVIKNLTFIGDHTSFASDADYIASVEAETTRPGYACHIDLGSQDVWIEDCIFRGRNVVAVGAGLHQDEHLRLIRCVFYDERSAAVAAAIPTAGTMYLHNMVWPNITNQNLLIEDCKFYGKNDCDTLVNIQCVNATGASGNIILLFNTLIKNGANVQNLFTWTTYEGGTMTLQSWNDEVSRGNNAEDMNY